MDPEKKRVDPVNQRGIATRPCRRLRDRRMPPRLKRSDRAQFAWTNVPLFFAWAWIRGTTQKDLRGNGNQHCHRQGLLEGQTSKVPDQGHCLHEHLRRGDETRDQ